MHISEIKPILASWLRVFVTAILTAYMSGHMDIKFCLHAGVLAVIPPILRWINPNDKAFGRGK